MKARWRIVLAFLIPLAAVVGIIVLNWNKNGNGPKPPHDQPDLVAETNLKPINKVVEVNPSGKQSAAKLTLKSGDTIEISCALKQPSTLQNNDRVLVEWKLSGSDSEEFPKSDNKPTNDRDTKQPPEVGVDNSPVIDFGVHRQPSPNFRKTLHALDPDIYMVYRAPVDGTYELNVSRDTHSNASAVSKWRESPGLRTLSDDDLRPNNLAVKEANKQTAISVEVNVGQIDLTTNGKSSVLVETEPNNVPEQAVPLTLDGTEVPASIYVVGGSDDIEYFDNKQFGKQGDDWFRLDFKGTEERLLAACLSIPDQQVVARIRCYSLTAEQADVEPGKLLPITREDSAGKNPNERVHQQKEPHRIAINRKLRPGRVYFLRVESNAPGYELEVQITEPAPYSNPQKAIERALHDHIGQVDAWLANRPRSVSVERRVRDTGNLLGTGCMSCHTQAGVWGPAVAFANGYRPKNVQLMRNLVNICYQSMRPTNELIDAVNNASLAPLDLGDGPAGTRVAGHAAVAYERFQTPRKLHSFQAIRAANNVLQTADPSAVNAAGPGANVGQGVVLNYAGEILAAAWEQTQQSVYFRALEDRARAMLAMKIRFTDDICHRVEFLSRFFPKDYLQQAKDVVAKEAAKDFAPLRVPYKSTITTAEESAGLVAQIKRQVTEDLVRLRATQNDDGSWGFNPGRTSDSNNTASDTPVGWIVKGSNLGEPSPTALALIAFEAAGIKTGDQAVDQGVAALLKMQRPSGLWKGSSLTGFVSTAYSLNALSRLFPVEPPKTTRAMFEPASNESLMQTIQRVRAMSVVAKPDCVPLMLQAAKHESPMVRYWAMIGLGSSLDDAAIAALVVGLGDRAKLVREASVWGFRQILIDDRGWKEVLEACRSTNDIVRAGALRTLVMRVDGVLPKLSIDWTDLTTTLANGMNRDPHPAVRAWAMRAAWNWWYWNPPVRAAINDAWLELLGRVERNSTVEKAIRYQTHALFILNGHHANSSRTHQYKELSALFVALKKTLDGDDPAAAETRTRIVRRLVGIGATYYGTSGGDGGPGQMGYVTPGSGELFGQAFLEYFKILEDLGFDQESDQARLQIGLEGAANIPHKELQQKLIHYSLNGPTKLRTIAATSVSDPRSAQLVAVPEMIEPLVRQIKRGANDAPRRSQLSDPIVRLFERVRWMVPTNRDQRLEILDYLIPKLDFYVSPLQLRDIRDPQEFEETSHRMSADRYLAEKLGNVLAANPDLHFAEVLERFPLQSTKPLESRFWLPSVPWILTFGQSVPEVGTTSAKESDSFKSLQPIRDRALEMFLQQLTPQAERSTRELAIRMSHNTVLRDQPRVIAALSKLEQTETNASTKRYLKNILATNNDLPRLLKAAMLREEPRQLAEDEEPSAELLEDFRYFRDHVVPEMNKPQREDRQSCFSCHGVPERVPPLTLKAPDKIGYLSVTNLLKNYRLLQQRIDVSDLDSSKLLRKPLNIQTGQEDGHQGGLRYRPNDPGYLILRKWVTNQTTK
jgi:hypothetical protein